MKRIINLTYAAIKRYGAKRWSVCRGTIEINTNYLISVGQCEIQGIYRSSCDLPFIVELSNGTKLLAYFHSYGTRTDDEMLGDQAEAANAAVDPDVYGKVSFYMLNQ